MPWFNVDDGFAFHRKAMRAGNAACGLWVRAGSWSAHQLTEGFVPDDIVATLGTFTQARRLVSAGLWVEVEGGFRFHEWTADGRNPTREQVLERRRKDREKKAKARSIRQLDGHDSAKPQDKGECPQGTRQGHPGGLTRGIPRGVGSTTPLPSTPLPKEQETFADLPVDGATLLDFPKPEPKPTYPEAFEHAWKAYGRKGAKKTAYAEWQRALKRASVDTITAAIGPYVRSTPDMKFRKDFERWLKGDCWESAIVEHAVNAHRPYANPNPNAYYDEEL